MSIIETPPLAAQASITGPFIDLQNYILKCGPQSTFAAECLVNYPYGGLFFEESVDGFRWTKTTFSKYFLRMNLITRYSRFIFIMDNKAMNEPFKMQQTVIATETITRKFDD